MAIRMTQGLVILGCLYLALVSGAWGVADWYARQAQDASLSWSSESLTIEGWGQAAASLRRALALDPSHPDYNHQMGRLLHIRMGLVGAERESAAGQSVEYLQQAIAERPNWGLTHANLALVKADARQFDAVFQGAVRAAVAVGAWEPGVQEILGSIASRGLLFQPEPTRDLLVQNMARGFASHRRGAANSILARLKRQPVFDYPLLAPALGQTLITQDWDRLRLPVFVETTWLLWNVWDADVRSVLAGNIVEALPDRRVVRLVQGYQRWPALCPLMARGADFDRYCSDG